MIENSYYESIKWIGSNKIGPSGGSNALDQVYGNYIYESIKKTLIENYPDILQNVVEESIKAQKIAESQYIEMGKSLEEMEKLPRMGYDEFAKEYPNVHESFNNYNMNDAQIENEIKNEFKNILNELENNNIITNSKNNQIYNLVKDCHDLNKAVNYDIELNTTIISVPTNENGTSKEFNVSDLIKASYMRAKINKLNLEHSDEINKLRASNPEFNNGIQEIQTQLGKDSQNNLKKKLYVPCRNQENYENQLKEMQKLKSKIDDYKYRNEYSANTGTIHPALLNQIIESSANELISTEGTVANASCNENSIHKIRPIYTPYDAQWSDKGKFGSEEWNYFKNTTTGKIVQRYPQDIYDEMKRINSFLGEPVIISEMNRDIIIDGINKYTEFSMEKEKNINI